MYKVAKGAHDIVGDEYDKIKYLIDTVEAEFIREGAEPLETPVFERTDVLLGKYGDEADTKLIYRLADEGGELLALRYDLTVPFTRYIKESGIKQMRRYSIGKVYRRDQPNIKSGRYREFIQADFDIYGEKQDNMVAEATVLNTVARILNKLGLKFTILLNDVRNLQYILQNILQITEWRRITPIIDKLDKQSYESLKEEFVANGLTSEQINKLEELLQNREPLFEDSIADFNKLASMADIFGFSNNIQFTNSLARGLDYYTGFIWEFKLDGIASTISAGGRYDNLLSAPTVGISVGISRLASYIPYTSNDSEWNETYYVTTIGNVNITDKMRIVKLLQDTTQSPVLYTLSDENRKLIKVINQCCKAYTRYLVVVGESEMKDNKYILKDLKENTQVLCSYNF